MPYVATLIILCLICSSAKAHFIWLEPVRNDNGTMTVQVYFGEDASPDDPQYLERIKSMTLTQLTGDERPTTLNLTLTDDSLFAVAKGNADRALFVAAHDLGVFDRGDAMFRLKYYAKTGPAITSSAWQRTTTAHALRLDVVPSFEQGRVAVKVTFDGEPAAGAEVTASGPGMDDFTGTTGADGQAAFVMARPGVHSIRACHVEAEAGTLDGKEYPETRHYSTLAVDVPAPLSQVPSEDVATIHELVTSFGAALVDGRLYTYGGHTGGAHSYSRTEQGDALARLDLETSEWETLAEGPPLQGLALVAHEGRLIRLGGFTARNAAGEEHDLWSTTSAARFDPQSGSWTKLPPLPEPRSSFDAAVLGDAVYVVGGWSLQGEAETVWHDTAWKLDLKSGSPAWQPLPSPPFQRRALAVAAHQGKLYIIGGMEPDGGPTRRVDVFDPATDKWAQGPDILGDDGFTGFGASAFATGGRLYVSTSNGTLQRLSRDGSAWEMVGTTPTARFFHRMLPLDEKHLLVVGGANMGAGKFETIEILSIDP